jgi:hypothetical protein
VWILGPSKWTQQFWLHSQHTVHLNVQYWHFMSTEMNSKLHLIKQYKCGVCCCSFCVKLLVHESQSYSQSASWSLWTTGALCGCKCSSFIAFHRSDGNTPVSFLHKMEPVAWDLLHIFVNCCHVSNRHSIKLACEFMMTLLVETVFSMSFIQKCTVFQWDIHYKCRDMTVSLLCHKNKWITEWA